MKLSDLKIGNKLGIDVRGCRDYDGFSGGALWNLDGHIDDIITNIDDNYITFKKSRISWKVKIQELLDKGLLEPEFVLPERWWITLTPENRQIVGEWFNKQISPTCSTYTNKIWIALSSHNGADVCITDNIFPKGQSFSGAGEPKDEITYEQFKQYVLKEPMNTKIKYTKQDWIDGKCAIKGDVNKKDKTNKFFKECSKSNPNAYFNSVYYISSMTKPGIYNAQDSNPSNLPVVDIDDLIEEEVTKKLVGYKCPLDINTCQIKKGNILYERELEFSNFYAKGKTPHGETLLKNYLPKEIVETWEAVYEEDIKIGGYQVKFSKDKLEFNNTIFKKNELEVLEEVLSDNNQIGITLKGIKVDLNLLKKLIENCK